MDQSLGQRLTALGWQCGSVIPESLYPHIEALTRNEYRALIQPQSPDWLIIFTQSCDLVAGTLEQEPAAEFLWCRPIPQPRAQFRDLRSTRRLDFRPDRENHPEVVLSVHAAHDRYAVPRNALERSQPRVDRTLSATSVRRLQAWLALRYSRPAWPDEFVQRLASAHGQIVSVLESVARDDLAEVRIAFAPSDIELDQSQSYRVLIYFVVDETVWNSAPESRQRIHAAFALFVSTLEKCRGVQVDQESGVFSGAQFTWQQMQITDLWNFANLTWRE